LPNLETPFYMVNW